jgi:hypothetical protein
MPDIDSVGQPFAIDARARPGPQYLAWYRRMRETTPVWRDPDTGFLERLPL